MKVLSVGEFKAHFSDVLAALQKGESFAVSYGKKREKVAVVSAYLKHNKKKPRKLGIWEGIASFKIAKNFKMTDEEFLNS
ncbi:prevent-host-death protein [Candidatus Gottesmanbacteria bacterium RIFCSPHIGHO2_02_FULL_39_14]|uniref:Prevent-host-death protein n=3 Tax=Candidatus Gottesmaniibacteriota TaxID=1752720 RepID=A0A1F5ZTN7_9BACT|nr:MAG: prevent-host-death protein [Candidatus Gottesmanbacteria bacterium RBG_16_38_7b]OGG15846.1 MAG: prevent-host-death protein [Candidatus Gottesmanbacteria bacterium RIFCSPHIGHO2_02_FULL_39_14]OGG30881.1 MAG: prevent-host-death protein [Candidatus Gottesmanbacteria bacterium RIFCSPLOWO2_02_FULL_38_8]